MPVNQKLGKVNNKVTLNFPVMWAMIFTENYFNDLHSTLLPTLLGGRELDWH